MDVTCQCGSIHFKTPTSTPLELYHCHCTECRKQSASSFGTSAIFPYFTLPTDLPLGCYTRSTDSGNSLDCYFCTKCGTRILHSGRHNKKTVSVKGGCVEGLDWSKAKHIWCSRAVVKIPEGVEKWDEEPDK
jgi:hypothetical protein